MLGRARESEIDHRRDFFPTRNVVPTPQPVMQLGCYVSVCGKVTHYASEDEAAKAVEELSEKEKRCLA